MSKKAFIAAIMLLLVLTSLFAIHAYNIAKANPELLHSSSSIEINSPQNQTYNETSIPLYARPMLAEVNGVVETLNWINYSLDGGVSQRLPFENSNIEAYTILSNLSGGTHFLTVYGETSFNNFIAANVTFTIDVPAPSPSHSPPPKPSTTVPSNSWEKLSPMPTSRAFLGAAVVNGNLYAIGGQNESANGAVNFLGTNEEYSPATNAWTEKTPMPTPRCLFAIASLEDKIYVFGGLTDKSKIGPTEMYDASNDSWKTLAPMPYPATQVQASVVDGKIYIFGGIYGYNATQIYDPSDNTWSLGASVPSGEADGSTQAAVTNKILLVDGFTGSSSLNLNQVYDTTSDSWSSAVPPPFLLNARSQGATTSGAYAPAAVIIPEANQTTGNLTQEPTQIYNPSNDSWIQGAPMPTPRIEFAVAIINDQIYAIGGMNYTSNGVTSTFSYLGTNERYSPIGYLQPNNRPTVSILSPQNDSFFNVTIEGVGFQLTYQTNSTLSWIGYSIDGAANVTASGNSTYVHGIESSGYHTLTVYANDTSGNWAAPQTVTYLVSVYPDAILPPTQQPTASPIVSGAPPANSGTPIADIAIGVVVVVALAASAVLLVYFRRRKG